MVSLGAKCALASADDVGLTPLPRAVLQDLVAIHKPIMLVCVRLMEKVIAV